MTFPNTIICLLRRLLCPTTHRLKNILIRCVLKAVHKPSLFSIPVNIKQRLGSLLSLRLAMFTPLRATRFHMQWYTLEPGGLLVWDVVYSSHVIWLTFMHRLIHLLHPGHAPLMGGTTLHWPWGWGSEPVFHSFQFPSSRNMHMIPELTTDHCSCYFFFSLGVLFSLKSPF